MTYQKVINEYECLNCENYKKEKNCKRNFEHIQNVYNIQNTSDVQLARSFDIRSYLLFVKLILFSISLNDIDKVDASFESEG